MGIKDYNSSDVLNTVIPGTPPIDIINSELRLPENTLHRKILQRLMADLKADYDGGAKISVSAFGAAGDGVTDDTAAIQAAIAAAAVWSLEAVDAGGFQAHGGGKVTFPQTDTGYLVSSPLEVPTKIMFEGPAKIIGTAGQDIFTFTYTGSTNNTGVIFDNLDFYGGDVAVNVGTNSTPRPCYITNCAFHGQEVAGVKIGANGYGQTIRDSLFIGGQGYGIWVDGGASDVLHIDHNIFIYNEDYDIYIEDSNVFRVTNNDFVSNQKTPESDAVNVYIDAGTSDTIGNYSLISANKFGQEGRDDGHCIEIAGTSGTISGLTIRDNLLHYLTQTSTNYAIKFGAKALRNLVIQANTVINCALADYSSTLVSGSNTGSAAKDNVTVSGSHNPQLLRGNWSVVDEIEPPSFEKYNIIKWSRYVSKGADFTYTNATPTYLNAIDETGVANNATSVTATSADNRIRINSVDTNSRQKFYSLAIWCKLGSEGTVTFEMSRSTNWAINQDIVVGTAWQRLLFNFHQIYYAAGNPYVFDIIIPDSATITLGGVCCVPGRDVGDLRRHDTVIERLDGVYGSAAPTGTGAYWTLGSIVWNDAPSAGNPIGWACTAAGTPGTWAAMPNL